MVSLRYSDILTDILNRKHSKCICPVEYLAGLKEREPKRPSTAECQFGPNCNFVTSCHFEPAKCTCHPQCKCGLEIPPSLPKLLTTDPAKSCLSWESDLTKPKLFTDLFSAQLDCDITRCTCTGCICRPQQSRPELFPICFQNTIKSQVRSKVCDDLMKKECEEIKQLIKQHRECEETVKAKPETSTEKAHSEKEVKMATESATKANDTVKSNSAESEAKSSGKNRKKSLVSPIEFDKETITESHRSVRKSGADLKSHVSKKETKPRRSKTMKKLYPARTKSMAERTNYYCGCKDYSKRKPPRIRYYYGGGTECYGSKVGHKNCVVPPLSVPKHMGWLWNKEDPSKGIRERKGWPPGFIARNIKHMMKVMKSFEGDAEGNKEEEGVLTWKSVEFTEEPVPEVEEPPLLHIHKKGRTYNITFCPKESDEDLSPIPIPFSITEKKNEGDSSTTDSSLEFELHSPKPKGKYPKMVRKIVSTAPKTISQSPSTEEPAASSTKQSKKKRGPLRRKRSQGSEENKINWEEQTTQMQNIT